MAQSAEHFLGKEEVTGSNPVSSSRERRLHMRPSFCFVYVLVKIHKIIKYSNLYKNFALLYLIIIVLYKR